MGEDFATAVRFRQPDFPDVPDGDRWQEGFCRWQDAKAVHGFLRSYARETDVGCKRTGFFITNRKGNLCMSKIDVEIGHKDLVRAKQALFSNGVLKDGEDFEAGLIISEFLQDLQFDPVEDETLLYSADLCEVFKRGGKIYRTYDYLYQLGVMEADLKRVAWNVVFALLGFSVDGNIKWEDE